MVRNGLSLPLVLLTLLLGLVASTPTILAELPVECAPGDREIEGNTNSPCKWNYHFDEITSVRYDVVENTDGNTCHEVLTFSPYDMEVHLPVESPVILFVGKRDEQGVIGGSGNWAELDRVNVTSLGITPQSSPSVDSVGSDNYRYFYSVDDPIPTRRAWTLRWRWGGINPDEYHALRIQVSTDGYESRSGINSRSAWLPMPKNIADFNLLMNDCLSGIKQRLENEAKLEEARQRVEAERVELNRAATAAAAEADRQQLETEAAREALKLARETELAKTQALIEQLEREKIIIGIWQEVVDEKLAGAKGRAEIMNTYLADIEANVAEFKANVVAKVAEVRRLEAINDAIVSAIEAHNQEIEQQLVAQEEREAEQRKKLDELHPEPEVGMNTPSPEPTTAP